MTASDYQANDEFGWSAAIDGDYAIVGAHKVDAVVHEPWGAHPSSMQGHYYTDLKYRFNYAAETKTIEDWESWLEKWITGVENREEYLKVLGEDRINFLKAKSIIQGAVDYGY